MNARERRAIERLDAARARARRDASPANLLELQRAERKYEAAINHTKLYFDKERL